MSDQGKWFKLWCSSLRDDDLENLSIHEWFGWARFGVHMKENGKDGKIRLRSPATAVVHLLRVTTFEDAIDMIKRFPNFVVDKSSGVTDRETVTYSVRCKNWNKYQGDWSRDRVRKFRQRVTSNVTAQEEKRSRREVEEKRRSTPPLSPPPISKGITTEPTVALPKAYRIPEKIKDPVGYLVMQYKIRKIGQDAFDDRDWDGHHWARAAAAAKDLNKITGGPDNAKSCLTAIADEFDKKGLAWTLETIVKWSHEWRKKGHGFGNSERFLRALTEQRSDQVIAPVGAEELSTKPNSNGVRDLPGVRT